MATLEEGQEYGLASNFQHSGNISVIHFKLNDSVLKALEDYCKVRNKVQRTTIQFKENQGVIHIPSHVSSAGNQAERNYQFSLSTLPDLNGSFDCVQQTTRQGHSSLQSLGNMQYKVSVHASDDVYDRTRAKMNLVEEESKKVCTKEIKLSRRHISHKVKKVLPAGSLKLAQVPKVGSLGSAMNKPTPSLGSGIRHKLSSSSTTTPASTPLSLKSSSNPVPSSFTRIQSSSPSTLSSPSQTKQFPNSSSMTKPPATSQQGVLTSASSKQSSGAINMPCRDRVIHLLALKPYKKPELILRLQREGIREKDRNCLGSVLQQVATLNKDQSFSLARSAWIEVRQDWSFYTDSDRTLLKKNLQQESRCMTTSPAVSPASSNPESPGSSQKRSIEEPDEPAYNPNKKKRISHIQPHPQEEHRSANTKHTNSQPSPDADRENLDGTLDNNGDPDYVGKYVNIQDKEQRQKYKQDFNRQYDEYRELHKEVDEVARRFQNLHSKINETEEGTKDFEELKKQVLEEYEAQKSDPKFMEKKRRMEYLHQKLGHIKKLIYEFDQRPVACS